jgi:hypothetical protein
MSHYQMERNQAKQKIAKLLKMTREHGATDEEARTAADKTVQLMLAYGIPLSEVVKKDDGDETDFRLINLVVRHGGIKAVRHRRGTSRKSGTLYLLGDGSFWVLGGEVARLIQNDEIEPDGSPDRWKPSLKAIAATVMLIYTGDQNAAEEIGARYSATFDLTQPPVGADQ